MAENSKIEWCDHTFNPWEGCQKISPGCDHCYAESRNARFGSGTAPNWGPGKPRRRTSVANWRKPRAWNREAEETGIRPRVFCASLADVFDNAVDPAWRCDLLNLIVETPNLDWLLLTKRIGNVADMLDAIGYECLPANVMLGATIVNQEEADRDIPKLLSAPASRLFLSMEPLLGPVDLTNVAGRVPEYGTAKAHGTNIVLATSEPITNGPGAGSSDAILGRLPTPMAMDGQRNGAGGHGDTGRMGTVRHMLATPRKSDASHGPEIAKAGASGQTGASLITQLEMGRRETLPTPTRRDKRMDAWSPAYDKRKSPTMDAVMDGALTNRASDKWAYARQIAALLTVHGLSGASMTLPVVYGWMMGYPPGWLECALLSAVREGRLLQPSSSKPMATRSSRKSRKPSEEPS